MALFEDGCSKNWRHTVPAVCHAVPRLVLLFFLTPGAAALPPLQRPCCSCQAALEKEADLRSEQVDQECAALPPTRLVLVVHGIGQQLSAANIAQVGGFGVSVAG